MRLIFFKIWEGFYRRLHNKRLHNRRLHNKRLHNRKLHNKRLHNTFATRDILDLKVDSQLPMMMESALEVIRKKNRTGRSKKGIIIDYRRCPS